MAEHADEAAGELVTVWYLEEEEKPKKKKRTTTAQKLVAYVGTVTRLTCAAVSLNTASRRLLLTCMCPAGGRRPKTMYVRFAGFDDEWEVVSKDQWCWGDKAPA